MKFIALVLALLFAGSVEAKTQQYWTCVDAAGHKAAQDFPCPEPLDVAPQRAEAPALSPRLPQSQQAPIDAAKKPKPQPIDFIGIMLKPLLPFFGMIVLVLLTIFAFKVFIASKVAKAKVKIGAKVVQGVLDRIEPSDDLLIKGYTPKTAIPLLRPTSWSLDLIRNLEWKCFEQLCEGYWRAKGYRAELTGNGADGGVDVNIYAPSEPTRLFAVIQCKSWVEQVGVKEIRELWGVTSHLNIKLALFYGLSGFTEEAKAFASNKHFKLFTGEDLLAQVQTLPMDQQQALLDHITRGDYTTPSCPKCDIKMVLRKGKSTKGDFWGCPNFRRCRSPIINIRS